MALSVPFPPLKSSQPTGPSRLPPSAGLSIHPSLLPSKVLLRIIYSYHISWSSTPSRDTCSRSLKPANAAFVSKCPFCSPHNFHSERMPSAPKRAEEKKSWKPWQLCTAQHSTAYSPFSDCFLIPRRNHNCTPPTLLWQRDWSFSLFIFSLFPKSFTTGRHPAYVFMVHGSERGGYRHSRYCPCLCSK